MRSIPYVDLPAQARAEGQAFLSVMDRVARSGKYVGGEEIALFEQAAARIVGVAEVVALNSGTDALMMALKLSGVRPGDEVITQPNSFIATAGAIVHLGAIPKFVDVLPDQTIDPDAVEAALSPKTRAILPAHLTGRMADMERLRAIASAHGIDLIEDAAQAIGSRRKGLVAGAASRFGCFSTHPLKNLAALGDGGFVATDDRAAAARMRALRNHGMEERGLAGEWGVVSRMDAIQAAILRDRIDRLPTIIDKRRRNAALYRDALAGLGVDLPPDDPHAFDTYHTFVIQTDRRDALKSHLKTRGVGSAVHYPIPLHLQPAAKALKHRPGDFPNAERQAERLLSLPIHQHLTPADIDYVAAAISSFLGAGTRPARKTGMSPRSRRLRELVLRALKNGGRGHVGPALSIIEAMAVLYGDVLNVRPDQPDWADRDRFILSKGHGCLAQFAALADAGFFAVEELDRFCRFDGLLGGHPEIKVPGVEASTGALGHGLPIGVGMALAARARGLGHRVFVLCGDGEINEGSVWEAALSASKHALSNLTVMVDYNKMQSAGPVAEVQPLEPLALKWRAFGFDAVECDGHDEDALRAALAPAAGDRPQVVICHTVKGKGFSAAEHNNDWHHKSNLRQEELDLWMADLDAATHAQTLS